jgi:UDP:flavonoid glycosyltransferase YjiC (YdhE family)
MKITIIAPGSRGDVQPYVALGKGLMDAGHSVQILTTHDFHELVTTYGLDFVDMGGQMEDVARQIEGLLKQGNFLKILKSMGQAAQELVNRASERGLEASQNSDRLIAGPGGLFVGLALSEKLGIPFIPAFYFPFTPTRAFPNALVPLPPIHLPGWANRRTHHIAQQMLWQNYRAADTQARREILGLPPASWWGPFEPLNRQQQTVIYGYSPLVLPRPADWGPSVHITGYWFLDPPADWEPPVHLVNFLESGSPPVFVGFGSMTNSKAEDTTRLVIEALARTGQRGVLSAGWGGLSQKDLPDSVQMIGSTPFSWLFPRMAAIVHHGGAGTTSIGLSAGIPSIVTPFMGDQPFWGQRVFELGVGPRPIPLRRLTAERLAQAIQTALTDTAMRQQAAILGKCIRMEDGVARAVEVIES